MNQVCLVTHQQLFPVRSGSRKSRSAFGEGKANVRKPQALSADDDWGWKRLDEWRRRDPPAKVPLTRSID